MFERIRWEPTQLAIGDVVFDLATARSGRPDDHIAARPRLIKDRALILDYERVFGSADIREGSRVFELGLWDGASAIFWAELLDPSLYLGVDLDVRGNSDLLEAYIARRGLEERLVTQWGVQQSDSARLRAIVAEHRAAPLDIVIDDASHRYQPTKASFEALFPLLREGGLYVIEDWAWAHWPEYDSPSHPWAYDESPTRLAIELIEATGTARHIITRVDVLGGLLAVRRGPAVIEEPFSLDRTIQRRRRPRMWQQTVHSVRRKARTAIGKLGSSRRGVV